MRVAGTAAAVGAVAAFAGVASYARLVEPHRLVRRDADLALPRWHRSLDGLTVALVGDLHVGSPGVGIAKVERIVAMVAAAEPDVVLLVGDFVADVRGGRRLHPREVAAALAPLQQVAPTWSVLGNHDWYTGGHRVRAEFEAAGLPVLEEESAVVRRPGGELWLAGVGDLWERRPDPDRALSGIPSEATTILMSHNPDVVLDVPGEVALTVAGHTHGGQVAPRGIPPFPVSPFTGNRFLRGRYDVEGRPMYVTSGVGTSLVPWRLGVVPEVVVLRLLALDTAEC